MNVLMPYHEGDYSRMLGWMKWTRELGVTGAHDLFLMPAKNIASTTEIEEIAREIFVTVTIVRDYEGVSGWPAGPNSCMRQAGWYFEGLKRGPWMFLENDAVPLVPDWLDQLEAEYLRAGKPFINRLVSAFADTFGMMIPDHGTGNMICPEDTPAAAPRLLIASDVAFDVYAAKEVLPKSHNTLLIQHVFNINGQPPTFPDQASLSLLQPGAVLFHRCKDGSLIERLRERKAILGSRNGTQGEPAAAPKEARPTPGTKPSVFTYYANVPSMDAEEQKWMIEKWKQSWSANGWEPVVLGITDCHFKKGELDILRGFASQNPIEYELACWARWVAMRDRGGLLADYDVLNYGFTPDDNAFQFLHDRIRLFDGYVPCVVLGSIMHFENIVSEFLSMKVVGLKHWSDMLALEALQGYYDTGSECVEYGKKGWKEAKLVHYAHGVCKGRPRSEVVPEAEKERSTVTFRTLVAGKGVAIDEPLSPAGHIDALLAYCKKDNFAKGRIVKALRAAGLVPAKK